jgi:hypothetical protein
MLNKSGTEGICLNIIKAINNKAMLPIYPMGKS